jgi:hypothetical protein
MPTYMMEPPARYDHPYHGQVIEHVMSKWQCFVLVMALLEMVVRGKEMESVTFSYPRATNCFLPLLGDMKWRTAMVGTICTAVGIWRKSTSSSQLTRVVFSFGWSKRVNSPLFKPPRSPHRFVLRGWPSADLSRRPRGTHPPHGSWAGPGWAPSAAAGGGGSQRKHPDQPLDPPSYCPM